MSEHLLVRNLAQTLMQGKNEWPTEFSIGKVATYDSGTGIATVEFEQTGIPVPCYVLSSYNPVAADVVAALRVGPSYIVLGSIATFIGGVGAGGTDTFEDLTGVATSTSAEYVPWVATAGAPYVTGPGNLVPDTLGGNPVARVTAAGMYIVHGLIALTTDTDTQARVDATVVQNGTGLAKALNGDILVLPAAPYEFSQISANFVLAFAGEVNDIILVRTTLGAGTGTALMAATALSIT